MFWVMVVISLSFIVMALAMVSIAVFVNRAVKSVNRLEEKLEPLIEKFTVVSEQGQADRSAGETHCRAIHRDVKSSVHRHDALLRIAGDYQRRSERIEGSRRSDSAGEARDKVDLVSNTIDRTHRQVASTTDFIQSKVIEPARELAAIMAGFRRGLEVLVAPTPKPVNQIYGEDEMFIG